MALCHTETVMGTAVGYCSFREAEHTGRTRQEYPSAEMWTHFAPASFLTDPRNPSLMEVLPRPCTKMERRVATISVCTSTSLDTLDITCRTTVTAWALGATCLAKLQGSRVAAWRGWARPRTPWSPGQQRSRHW